MTVVCLRCTTGVITMAHSRQKMARVVTMVPSELAEDADLAADKLTAASTAVVKVRVTRSHVVREALREFVDKVLGRTKERA